MERFWNKIDIKGPNDCWEWKNGTHNGYGVYWHNGRNVRANRFALELTAGPSPFEGAMSLHSCDNPTCCNPGHLRWGTNQENKDDFILRKGRPQGERSPTATLTNEQVDRIYQSRLDGKTIGEISEELGAPYTTVENVYIGRSWSHRLGIDGNPTLEELRKSKPSKKRQAYNRLVTDDLVDDILKARVRGESASDIAERLGLPLGTVSPVHSGLAFTHRHGVNGNPTFDELRSVQAANPNQKLTVDDILEIKALLSQGYWGKDIAQKYGVSKATISNIKKGKR